MNRTTLIFGGIGLVVVILILVVIYVSFYLSSYNGLVVKNESVKEGKSKFAAAVNTCSQKMKSVWTLADQEGILEKETYVKVAQARSQFDESQKSFESAKSDNSKSVLDLTTLAAGFGKSLLNIRIAFEAYPDLKTSQTYQKAMSAIEEGFNEIKTALDDWIHACKEYNVFRKKFVTNWFASSWTQFPEDIKYYDGGIEQPEKYKLSTDELNPKIKKNDK